MKARIFVLLLLAALLLCGCTAAPTAPADDPGPSPEASETPEPTAEPTPEPSTEPTPEPTPDPSPEPTPEPAPDMPEAPAEENALTGRVEEGYYRSDFLGMRFPLDDGWILLDREAIALNMGFNSSYASASAEDLLSYHYPYVDLWAQQGTVTVQFMLEATPITCGDGSQVSTPSDYMAHNAEELPRQYQNLGIPVEDTLREQREICGRSFELFRFTVRANGIQMTQTMLATDLEGTFFTIYITCLGEDASDTLLAQFEPLP